MPLSKAKMRERKRADRAKGVKPMSNPTQQDGIIISKTLVKPNEAKSYGGITLLEHVKPVKPNLDIMSLPVYDPSRKGLMRRYLFGQWVMVDR